MKFTVFLLVPVIWAGIILAQIAGADTQRHLLAGLYEPSGLVQLPDGRILVVEDEKQTSLSVLHAGTGAQFSSNPLPLASKLDRLLGLSNAPRLDDLEAATLDTDGYVYVITSHSRTEAANRFKRREKLVRFRLDGSRIADISIIRSLHDQITELTGKLAKSGRRRSGKRGLNIEGMAYDPADTRLLIGLRQPVIDGQAVVLPLPDPERAFSNNPPDTLLEAPIYLDLAGGGIRAMTYYPRLGGFLIISRKEKRGTAFKLWFWNPRDGQPRRVKLAPEIDLQNAEGVSVVRQNGAEQIMLVFDNGTRKQFAEYSMLTHEQILAGLAR
ncbi:DUF3616 domain-containing protein [Profundibacter sp.]